MCSMIQETITYQCRACGSPNIVKNGKNKCGNVQYHCKDCKVYRGLMPKSEADPKQREQILQTYRERASLREEERIFGVHLHSELKWLTAHERQLPRFVESLLRKRPRDIIE